MRVLVWSLAAAVCWSCATSQRSSPGTQVHMGADAQGSIAAKLGQTNPSSTVGATHGEWVGRYEGMGQLAGQGVDVVRQVPTIAYVTEKDSATLSILVVARTASQEQAMELELRTGGASLLGPTLVGTDRQWQGTKGSRQIRAKIYSKGGFTLPVVDHGRGAPRRG